MSPAAAPYQVAEGARSAYSAGRLLRGARPAGGGVVAAVVACARRGRVEG